MDNFVNKSCMLVGVFLSINLGYSAGLLSKMDQPVNEDCIAKAKNKYTIQINYGHAQGHVAELTEEHHLPNGTLGLLIKKNNEKTLTMTGSNGYREGDAIERLKFLYAIILEDKKFMERLSIEEHNEKK